MHCLFDCLFVAGVALNCIYNDLVYCQLSPWSKVWVKFPKSARRAPFRANNMVFLLQLCFSGSATGLAQMGLKICCNLAKIIVNTMKDSCILEPCLWLTPIFKTSADEDECEWGMLSWPVLVEDLQWSVGPSSSQTNRRAGAGNKTGARLKSGMLCGPHTICGPLLRVMLFNQLFCLVVLDSLWCLCCKKPIGDEQK